VRRSIFRSPLIIKWQGLYSDTKIAVAWLSRDFNKIQVDIYVVLACCLINKYSHPVHIASMIDATKLLLYSHCSVKHLRGCIYSQCNIFGSSSSCISIVRQSHRPDSDGKWLTVFVEHLSSITVQLQQLVPEDRQQKEVVSYYKATSYRFPCGHVRLSACPPFIRCLVDSTHV